MTEWLINKYQLRKVFYLLGNENPNSFAKDFTRKIMIYSLSGLISLLILSMVLKNLSYLGVGIMTIYLFFRIQIRNLHEKVHLRNRNILLSLPSQISNWCVQMTAGTNIQSILTAYYTIDHKGDLLLDELSKISHRIRNGYSISAALHEFSSNCHLAEISKLVYFIQIHLKNGDNLQHHLMRLNEDLWNNKKYLARKQGEEATSKLLFPMLIMLITIMGTVIYPVFILMRGDF